MAKKIIFLLGAGVCLLPFMDAGLALLLGFALALCMPHPYPIQHKQWSHVLLQASVVGLGFGLNIHSAVAAGRSGLLLTVASISISLAFGIWLGARLHIGRKATYLISAGTAICGGSAIAAIAPLVSAKESDMSISMGTVFLLNAIALFLFPWVGHLFHLSPAQFGLWAAIAIHDTSSVIGAASRYNPLSVEIATTVKLARALWIIPVSLATLLVMRKRGASSRVRIPWFIFLFILVVLLHTFLPAFIAPFVLFLAKRGLVLTLFLIGTSLSPKVIRQTGVRPLVLGIGVWTLIAVGSLSVILWHA
ncbi:YeiH family protein [Dinghuibacter silviterrae]|uniref:Putative integral membrane protein (TIGR00698 family) n=1 Tax=Dinghuibacter silviterrae TaxID=1539049 RepID=A0A4R8DF03_9BACT|nr:putative sulfate exporter family transporter [Dinghuibacter silviterrae]TDW96025.1 putative integral membrane protein (TIGR00698 family) [Dinghuibacter silviterrae]